ncbi:FAD-binding oxidoreductase [Kitasatospora atroaurantiaca]|uniref:FAD/FMN-containing dehydrogenase n=1 Tax=Kitasatospora atroaurantiaca TaxID=285545 RepID=A0A561EMN6_9ACTN|nr:FAD-binding oxidoreductase [Kitasatospora atroaurantiaca]TWE16839.1 FAD/FMN-containing dehydrogenase [Kitasatospora atroaurantiaca]
MASVLDSRLLTDLRAALTGDVIARGDDAYDEARTVFNGMIDRRPKVIAQCVNDHDVAAAIAFAREHGLEIAVRGGGHGVAGTAVNDGGLVVDLRRMNAVTVDPEAGIARVGGGATFSNLDRATQPYGLATTGGRASTTGVGGFTLGGGSGWVERKFGLACDNLLAVRLVTADGRTVLADENRNSELFWALHGGGGNFGVATEFDFRLHSLPVIYIALLLWPAEAGPDVARAYRDFMAAAPDEVGGGLLYLTGPPEEFVPAELVGKLAVGALFTYTGGEAQAKPVIRPMLELGHAGGMLTELPYAELQCMLDDPSGFRNYWSAEYLDGFPDPAVDLFCARAHDMVVPSGSQHALLPMGGAVARGSADLPVPWRAAAWGVHPFGMWEDPADDARGRQWARDLCADLKPWSMGAVYLNFIGDEGEERTVAGRGERNARRLAAVKTEYDPENVFHLNHNIAPG